jgi:Holliday junction resolvase
LRVAKVDANQPEIVKELRKIGAFVQSLASIGKGCPDLLVGFRGKWHLFEVKDESKPVAKRKLTADEIAWIWEASKRGPVYVVESTEQALKIVTE